MDNQTTNQETTETSVNQTPINPEPVAQTPVTVPEMPAQEPELQPQPETVAPSNEYQQVLNEYAVNTEKLPPINTEPAEAPTRSSEEQLQNLGISPPPKTSGGFIKVFFIIALIIFIFVIAALGLAYFKSQQSPDNSDSSSFDTVKTSPTPISGNCFLNDKTYQIGESFAAADGCNTCTCDSADVISCTEKACATPTAIPTKVATESATITPTKAITPTPTN